MKKALLALGIMALCLLFVSCGKTTKPTDPEPTTFEPYVDENGKLNVDVSDYEFPEE